MNFFAKGLAALSLAAVFATPVLALLILVALHKGARHLVPGLHAVLTGSRAGRSRAVEKHAPDKGAHQKGWSDTYSPKEKATR